MAAKDGIAAALKHDLAITSEKHPFFTFALYLPSLLFGRVGDAPYVDTGICQFEIDSETLQILRKTYRSPGSDITEVHTLRQDGGYTTMQYVSVRENDGWSLKDL